ncbi:hypothetical protein [Pleurocapsa sp. PCC 7319]|uniref:hypothetical protein n=1 Tax=Pleurocapsa sp. PCC 7319 TaxID=118161 RepID=UPI00034941D4|nr:hypothetical protein [Pleurocapsa sp. PCC 7319]
MQSVKKKYFPPQLEELKDFTENHQLNKIITSQNYDREKVEKLLRSKNNLANYLSFLHS